MRGGSAVKENVDWAVLELPGVMEVLKKAASNVGSTFAGVTEADDIEQELVIWAATHPSEVRGYVERDELGLLYRRAQSRGHHVGEHEALFRNRVVSIDRLVEE